MAGRVAAGGAAVIGLVTGLVVGTAVGRSAGREARPEWPAGTAVCAARTIPPGVSGRQLIGTVRRRDAAGESLFDPGWRAAAFGCAPSPRADSVVLMTRSSAGPAPAGSADTVRDASVYQRVGVLVGGRFVAAPGVGYDTLTAVRQPGGGWRLLGPPPAIRMHALPDEDAARLPAGDRTAYRRAVEEASRRDLLPPIRRPGT